MIIYLMRIPLNGKDMSDTVQQRFLRNGLFVTLACAALASLPFVLFCIASANNVIPPASVETFNEPAVSGGEPACLYAECTGTLESTSHHRLGVPHPPIRINSDFELGTKFPGGIISNLDIDGGGYGYGIYIGNCSNPFVIENCTISNVSGYSGHPYFMDAAISIQSCGGGIIKNNVVNGGVYGIYISIAGHCEIVGNTISGSSADGIHLEQSPDASIRLNSIGYCIYNAIYLTLDSHRATILKNTCVNNAGSGVYINRCDNILICNCTFDSDGNNGITAMASDNLRIANTSLCDNFGDGAYIDSCHGFVLETSNTSFNNGNGIQFRCSENITINKCIVIKNKKNGIRFESAKNPQFTGNRIGWNTQEGIWAMESNNSTFRSNRIDRNSIGVYLLTSFYNGIFTENTIDSNTGYAVHILTSSPVQSKHNRFWKNYFISNNEGLSIPQARDDQGMNFWNISGTPHGYGNYWSDWTTPDSDGNGIVDNPYEIAGGSGSKDFFPLTNPTVPETGMNLLCSAALPAAAAVVAACTAPFRTRPHSVHRYRNLQRT